MPLILKRRIWWEPVAGVTGYVVYVSTDNKIIDPAKFSWGNTPGMISKRVFGKTELIIPDEWPEFPTKPGTYHIAITSRDRVENQSDPLVLSGVFSFVAPASPSEGGIESFPLVHLEPGTLYHSRIWEESPPLVHLEPGTLDHSRTSQGRTIIDRGLEEVKNNKELEDAYLGSE